MVLKSLEYCLTPYGSSISTCKIGELDPMNSENPFNIEFITANVVNQLHSKKNQKTPHKLLEFKS